MARPPQIRLNSAGMQDVLKSPGVRRTIAAKTQQVADAVRSQGIKVGDVDGGSYEADMPVETDMVVTDRAHGRVTVAHAAGQAVQAKHGALTKAALEAGLEVNVK